MDILLSTVTETLIFLSGFGCAAAIYAYFAYEMSPKQNLAQTKVGQARFTYDHPQLKKVVKQKPTLQQTKRASFQKLEPITVQEEYKLETGSQLDKSVDEIAKDENSKATTFDDSQSNDGMI